MGRGSAPDEVQAGGGADNGSDLAVKLNKLFGVMREAGTPPLSNAVAAAAITSTTGVPVSPAYLWQLRSGLKTNPTVQHLRAIAEFFGVPASYLIDRHTDQKIEAQLGLMQALRGSGVRDLALRTSGLTPQAISSLAAMVDEVRKLQDLPPMPPGGWAGLDDV